jgi:hypothetical protein
VNLDATILEGKSPASNFMEYTNMQPHEEQEETHNYFKNRIARSLTAAIRTV